MIKNLFRRSRKIRSIYHHWLGWRNALRSIQSPFIKYAPAGHFYSPLPELKEIESRKNKLFKLKAQNIPAIELQSQAQLDLLTNLQAYLSEFPFPPEKTLDLRYFWKNEYFSIHDALILLALMRYNQPRHIIEIGSGFSSALMLDTADLFLADFPNFTFIEPYPDRLLDLLRPTDRQRCTILQQPVQEVELSVFQLLTAGDILFIDSSHVAKIGSDVLFILFEILPSLNPGVWVHFHDISWPFEYPIENFQQGIAWNEAYTVRAFLQYNSTFKIRYYSSYISTAHKKALENQIPAALLDPGCSSLWILKEKQAKDDL